MSIIVLALLSGATADQVTAAPPPLPVIQDISKDNRNAIPPPPGPMIAIPRSGRNAARTSANLLSLFTDDDYPPEAIRNNEQGTVFVALNVGIDGRVGACTVLESSGSAVLDAATCRILMRRARFRPAHDGRGRAVPDIYRQRVRWQLPVDLLPTSDRFDRTTVRLGATGTVIGCTSEDTNRPPSEDPIEECNSSQDVVDALAEMIPGIRAGKYKAIIMERRLYFPATGYPQWQAATMGTDLMGDDRGRMEIGPDGKLAKCEPLGHVGPGMTIPLCTGALTDAYEPLPPDAPQNVRVGFTQVTFTGVKN